MIRPASSGLDGEAAAASGNARTDIPIALWRGFMARAGVVFWALFPIKPINPLDLFAARTHTPLFERQRAQLIISRVRVMADLFAILTPLWIIVDALALPGAIWLSLGLGRILTSTAFIGLSVFCRCRPTTRNAYVTLGLLFAIPSAFFLFSHSTLSGVSFDAIGKAVATGYIFLPFVLVSGLGVFPLTFVEISAFAFPILIIAALPVLGGVDFGLPVLNDVAVLWLLALIGALAALVAMSQLQLMAGLFQKTTRDPLTRAFNRASGEEIGALLFAEAHRYVYALSVAFLDLDDFKLINDTAGHEAGDAALRQMADAFMAASRASDALVRWGGEEFLLLLPHTDSRKARDLLHRLGAANPCLRPDGRPLTFSAGIADTVHDAAVPDWPALVALADQRMYQAKSAGKARIVTGGENAASPQRRLRGVGP